MEDYAMSVVDIRHLRSEVKMRLRERVLEAIEIILEEEVTEVLGVARHERNEERRGYRNGSIQRTVTTAQGTQRITVPRARVEATDGTTQEFESELLPRYQWRMTEVDEAILGALCGRGQHTSHPDGTRAPLGREAFVQERDLARCGQTQSALRTLAWPHAVG